MTAPVLVTEEMAVAVRTMAEVLAKSGEIRDQAEVVIWRVTPQSIVPGAAGEIVG